MSVEPARDGMAWLNAYLPAADAFEVFARLDADARAAGAARAADEGAESPRTLPQLRADFLHHRIVGCGPNASVRATVHVVVPVGTLIDAAADGSGEPPAAQNAPAILAGYGPIDNVTAARLAARAPSFQRILTHPLTGTVLDVDRASYRVPADLKRWLAVRDGGCVFPGCARGPEQCDLDHTIAWQDGGRTSADNLAHLCRHHHRLKHRTAWNIARADPARTSSSRPDPRRPSVAWTAPSGRHYEPDPAPF